MRRKVVQPPGLEVDKHDFALMSSAEGAYAFLEWGYERAYRNEISVWGENASLYSDFIFSKPPDHVARVSVRDRHGELSYEDIEPADSYCEMFRAFARAVDDPALRERLRKEAELQATCLESLRRNS